MRRTIFTTPLLNSMLHYASKYTLRLLGWKLTDLPVKPAKYVLIGAPHTSNWDFIVMLLVCFTLKLKVHWMGKHTLFPYGLGWLSSWLGGIPVVRSQKSNLVQTTIDAFANSNELVVLIPPEGTRSKVTRWKTGFYHIASGANVPVVLGFMDFKNKKAGLGGSVTLTGDIENELPKIQKYYAGMHGKNRKLDSD